MRKLIEKHLQKNGRGRGIIQFSPETYIFVPGMNTTSNPLVQQANQRVRQNELVERETPKTRAEGSYRNVERRRKSGKTKDLEDTERDIKLATQPTWRSDVADALHYAGTGLSTVGGGLALLSNPITIGTTLVGGTVGGKVVDKASQNLTGKTWAENIQEKLGLQTPTLAEFTNPGYFIGGGLGLKGKDALRLLDRAGLYGLGRYGSGKAQNWARAKLISNEMKLSNPMETIAINAIGKNGMPETLHTSYSMNFKPYNIASESETPSILSPKDWLNSWTEKSGKEIRLDESSLNKLFEQTKERVRLYIHGDEFKLRLINSGLFTEKERSDLIKVLEERLDNTKFKGTQLESGAENRYYAFDDGLVDTSKNFEVYAYPTHSPALHRANMWHELWHSLGGRDGSTDPNPLIQKLLKYNESINPTNKSSAIKTVESMIADSDNPEQAIVNALKSANPDISDRALARFARNENKTYNFLNEEIVNKNLEVRSRMLATLDRFRNLGYDTKELINDPSKFIKWVNEIKNNRIYMPWDLLHLLQTYNIKDLANYASKMLSTTGGVYLGTLLNNNSKNNNYGKNSILL